MSNKINFGVMTNYLGNLENNFKQAAELGLDSIMMTTMFTDYIRDDVIKKADDIKAMMSHYGVTISALWAGWGEPAIWNFYEGQDTLGLIPIPFRDRRIRLICNAATVAQKLGVHDVITHAGFMPENPNDPLYTSFINMMRYYCEYHFKPRDVFFDFETGQETPVTVRRAIEDIGTGNCGINLDTGNLICYGKANPVDAIKIFGQYVRCTHLKDCVWPKSGRKLGGERKLGEGDVDFPEVIRLLNEHKYKGHFTIEREIEGPQQNADILEAATFIRAEAAKYNWDFKEEE